MSRATAFYDQASWYDFLHGPDTEAELAGVLALFERHGNGGRDVLEPACGTGRYLAALAERGFRAVGYDVNDSALDFARGRLECGAEVVRADMRDFVRPGGFDLAFCTLGSIRHLLTEADVRRHLRLVGRSLRAGGVYVVGLDLTEYTTAQDDEETWEVRRGGRSVKHVMMSFAPVRRRERILHFVQVEEGGKKGLIESEYVLRSYDAEEWRGTVAAAGLRVVGEEGGLYALGRAGA